MKPIINIEFTGEIPLDECQSYFQEVSSILRNEGYGVIGTFKPFMEIKEICGDSRILKFNDTDYTAAEIMNILEEYENGKLKQ